VSEESTMVIGEYRTDIKAMCLKKRSISNYKFTQNALS